MPLGPTDRAAGDRPRLHRKPSVEQLQRDLADRLNAYPPRAWSGATLTAVIRVLDFHIQLRESRLNLSKTRALRVIR